MLSKNSCVSPAIFSVLSRRAISLFVEGPNVESETSIDKGVVGDIVVPSESSSGEDKSCVTGWWSAPTRNSRADGIVSEISLKRELKAVEP